MEHSFKNNWAVILGGSSGLGLASAQLLASHGMNICIVHRDRRNALPELNKAIDEMTAQGVDVRTFNKDALAPATRHLVLKSIPEQKVKLLLHSIAKGSLKPMVAEDDDALLTREDLAVTLHGMATSWYEWSQELIRSNKFVNGARNIAFTSEGNTKVWPGYGAVSAAKATLEALMRNMAVEMATLGITTNCIQAGTTLTPSFKRIPGSDRLTQLAKERNPMERLTTSQDVAKVVYLLCKEEAAWINGSVIKADGGESIR